MTSRAEPSTSRLLTIADLQRLLRCGRTTVYARTREPGFPRPLVISAAAYRWWEDEVIDWLEKQRADAPLPSRPRGVRDVETPEPAPIPTPRAVRRRNPAGG